MTIMQITQDQLRDILSYDPRTGIFTWKKSGRSAGCKNSSGYIVIRIGNRPGKLLYAHRLAWLYMTGEWPTQEIDHIDRDRSNNKIDNLRQATIHQNRQNRPPRSDSSSGIRGVFQNKLSGSWRAKIAAGNKTKNLGSHIRFCEAIKARKAAEIALHGEFSPRAQ